MNVKVLIFTIHNNTLEDVYGNLMNLPWKYLEFQWSGFMSEGCILGQFILRLMSRSLTLQQLVIKEYPIGVELKEGNRPEGELQLPNLKTIWLPARGFRQFRDLFSTLLARAPNVQELLNFVSPYWIAVGGTYLRMH